MILPLRQGACSGHADNSPSTLAFRARAAADELQIARRDVLFGSAVPVGKAHCGGRSRAGLHALESLSPVIAANTPVALPKQMRSIDLAPLMLQVLGVECR